MPRHKRPRGGQPGNQNARKHGFYSSNMTLQEAGEFWNIVNLEGADPQVVALRIKIGNALHNASGNYRVIREASKLLARYVKSQNSISKKDYTQLKSVIRSILKAAASGDENLTKRIVAESLGKDEKSKNDSYLIQVIDNKNQKTNRG